MCQLQPHWLLKNEMSFVPVVGTLNDKSNVCKQISSLYVCFMQDGKLKLSANLT